MVMTVTVTINTYELKDMLREQLKSKFLNIPEDDTLKVTMNQDDESIVLEWKK